MFTSLLQSNSAACVQEIHKDLHALSLIQLYFIFTPILAFLYFIFVSLFLVGCLCMFNPKPCPVLEFELRKAKETIQALRANLTQAAGGVHKPFP